MRRVADSRRHLADLLRRRPLLDRTVTRTDTPAGLRRDDEVREMLDLVDREFLSPEELERHRRDDPTTHPRGSSRT